MELTSCVHEEFEFTVIPRIVHPVASAKAFKIDSNTYLGIVRRLMRRVKKELADGKGCEIGLLVSTFFPFKHFAPGRHQISS